MKLQEFQTHKASNIKDLKKSQKMQTFLIAVIGLPVFIPTNLF